MKKKGKDCKNLVAFQKECEQKLIEGGTKGSKKTVLLPKNCGKGMNNKMIFGKPVFVKDEILKISQRGFINLFIKIKQSAKTDGEREILQALLNGFDEMAKKSIS